MLLNKKICPQNKYLRFPIHKLAQTWSIKPLVLHGVPGVLNLLC